MFFIKKLLACLNYLPDKRLSKISFSSADIVKALANLNANKAYGQDKVSILTLKNCGNKICRLLEIIFKQYFDNKIFPVGMEGTQHSSYSQKGDKQSS